MRRFVGFINGVVITIPFNLVKSELNPGPMLECKEKIPANLFAQAIHVNSHLGNKDQLKGTNDLATYT